MCNHENISHATSSDFESVCADCGEVVDTAATPQGSGEMMKTKRQWKRQPWGDRYKLTSGEWEITAVGVGHDEVRSYYILKRNGVVVDEFDMLRDAKSALEWES